MLNYVIRHLLALTLIIIGHAGSVGAHPPSSLKALYRIIEAKNPELLKTFYEQEATQQDFQSAKSGLFPQIIGNYAVGKNRSVLPGLPYRTANGNQQTILLRQLLFDGFKIYHSALGAKGDYAASKALTSQLLNTLGFELASSYFNAIRLEKLVQLSNINLDIHQQTYQKMRSRFDSGASAKSEVTLARARLAAARDRLYAYQGELKNTYYTLEKLVGQRVHVKGSQSLPSRFLPKSLKESMNIALDNNWTIKVARRRLTAAEERLKEQKARFWAPDVSFQLSGFNNKNYSTLRGVSRDLQGSIVVDYTFFEGGNYTAQYNKAIKLTSAAKEDLQQSLRLTKESVQSEWNNLKVSKRRVKALTNHVHSIRQTLELFKKEFELGKRSLLNVLDSTNELYNSRVNLEDAKYQIKTDTFAIFASQGSLPQIYNQKNW
jgi:adhesin transport system outer membrane protein